METKLEQKIEEYRNFVFEFNKKDTVEDRRIMREISFDIIRGLLGKKSKYEKKREKQILELENLQKDVENRARDIYKTIEGKITDWEKPVIPKEQLYKIAQIKIKSCIIPWSVILKETAIQRFLECYEGHLENLTKTLNLFGENEFGDCMILDNIYRLRKENPNHEEIEKFLNRIKKTKYHKVVEAIQKGKEIKLITGTPYGYGDGIRIIDRNNTLEVV